MNRTHSLSLSVLQCIPRDLLPENSLFFLSCRLPLWDSTVEGLRRSEHNRRTHPCSWSPVVAISSRVVMIALVRHTNHVGGPSAPRVVSSVGDARGKRPKGAELLAWRRLRPRCVDRVPPTPSQAKAGNTGAGARSQDIAAGGARRADTHSDRPRRGPERSVKRSLRFRRGECIWSSLWRPRCVCASTSLIVFVREARVAAKLSVTGVLRSCRTSPSSIRNFSTDAVLDRRVMSVASRPLQLRWVA